MTRVKDFVYLWQLPIAILVVVVVYVIDHRWNNDQLITTALSPVRKETYGAVATIFGALFGFVITAFSIVVSLTNSAVMKKLRQNGEDKRVNDAFIQTTYVVGLATAVSLAAIFLDAKTDPNRLIEYIVMFIALWATLAVIGIISVLEILVKASGKIE